MGATASFQKTQARVMLAALVTSLCLGLGPAEPQPKKLFFIGLNKTGTKTLSRHAQLLGLHSCHEFQWARASKVFNTSYFQLYVPECQAFSDGDRPAFEWLDATFPGSAFVLNTRPLESWLVSRQAFYRLVVSRDYPGKREKELDVEFRTRARDVRRWLVDREVYHARVLRYFMNESSVTNASTLAALVPTTVAKHPLFGARMATTGTIYRRDNPADPAGPPSFFMMVDVLLDSEAKVKEQLATLLKVSGLDAIVQGRRKIMRHVGVLGGVYPENEAQSKKCVSKILDALALTAEERASDLILGRPVPSFPAEFDGARCQYESIDLARLKKKKDAQSAVDKISFVGSRGGAHTNGTMRLTSRQVSKSLLSRKGQAMSHQSESPSGSPQGR